MWLYLHHFIYTRVIAPSTCCGVAILNNYCLQEQNRGEIYFPAVFHFSDLAVQPPKNIQLIGCF